jgi:hypothetical protein
MNRNAAPEFTHQPRHSGRTIPGDHIVDPAMRRSSSLTERRFSVVSGELARQEKEM